ncbi:MAG TPA: hypothetical protein VK716_12190 [Terracidiphilus sp.]|jgi:hypothetical protein|nr:hypothetical protein [Terracidiphilus sp.]
MILQTTEHSPNQQAGSQKQQLKIASPADRQLAADQMRYQLYLLDRTQRRMSIEDCMAALLEQSSTELPA